MAVRNPVAQRALLSLKSPAGDDLIPVRLVAREKISEMFHFEIEAMSTETIKPLSMLNMEACLMINYREQPIRYFHGIISHFEAAGRKALEQRYLMILRTHQDQNELNNE